MQNRNYTIDLLRFFAATAVVLFHLNCKTDVSNGYVNALKFGWLGVPVFFVVSGFCIGMAANHSKSATDFFVRRFFRIFPAYWFSLLVVMAVVVVGYLNTGTNSVAVLPKTFIEVSATISLLTNPFSSVGTINGVYWSLTVEIFFYLVIGLSWLITRRFRNVFILGISTLALFPTLSKIPGLFFLSEWAAFGVGFALYLIKSNKETGFLPWLLMAMNGYLLIFGKSTEYSVVALITLCTIALSVFWKDIPVNKLSKLGDYSYSIYLIHGPVSIFIYILFKPNNIHQSITNNIAWDLGILFCVGIFSVLMYKYVELPGISFGKKASRKLSDKKLIFEPAQTRVTNEKMFPIVKAEPIELK